MIVRVVLALALSTSAFAQGLDPLRNVSGTTSNPGAESLWVRSEPSGSGWTFFHGFDAHVTYVSETGPEEQRNEVFSTNWFGAGVHANLGERGFVLVRGRVSLEPFTIPEEEGYPQILQYVSPEAGGQPTTDRMRAHDFFGEAAVHAGWRPTQSTLLHVYGALVGDPALGTAPSALRATSVDFAEAPFSYDIQESFHDSTSVITVGFATRWISIDGSVFHDAVTTGDHTEIDSGDIDSRSARVTLTPSPNLAIQVSRGELGEDLEQRDVTSGSLSYGTQFFGLTALWTKREYANGIRPSETAYGAELTLRGARHSFLGRAEWVDRPLGFPETPDVRFTEETTHFAVGYLFDFIASNRYRAGVGVNIDYHTQSHDLEHRYGHKPQSIYAFARFRTSAR
ncbi:MAG: hypothetical protein M3P06_04205 [Acidobacteriota bacterium]|nr:hypothetical protein [Acidobacteriota bacterium]